MDNVLFTLSMIWKIIFIAFFFGFCIFIHEFGHLLAALWRGLHVEKFSIGFGKRLWGFTYRGVEFVISLLPFGGYVMLPQLDPTDEPKTSTGEALPPGKPSARAIAAFAGPFFNVLFGFALATVMWLVGVWEPTPATSCVVLSVPPTLPLYQDGLKFEDTIIAHNGEPVDATWEELCEKIAVDAPPQTLTVKRKDGPVELTMTPVPNPEWLAGLRAGDRIVAVNGKPFTRGVDEVSKEYVYSKTPEVTLTVEDGNGRRRDLQYLPAPNPRVEDLGLPFFTARNPVAVSAVVPDSPAARADLRAEDQLLAINGKTITSARMFLNEIQTLAGQPVRLLVTRKHKELELAGLELPTREGDAEISMEQIGVVFTVFVDGVIRDMPAYAAGIRHGDRIKKANGRDITDSAMFTELVRETRGAPLTLLIERNGNDIELSGLSAVPREINGKTIYFVGLTLSDNVPKVIGHPSPWAQFMEVVSTTGRTLGLLFSPLTARLSGKELPANRAQVKVEHMSGPLGIIMMLWYKLKLEGIRGGLSFIILISFSLALINLLPLPILDGGHIVFAAIEAVTRRRLPAKFLNVIQNVFAFLLIALMLYITFFDSNRLYQRAKLMFQDKGEQRVEPAKKPEAAPAAEAAPALETAPAAEKDAAP
ncbi:MAG: site-2 protease family protein [Lentisphaeria bacterium]